VPVSAGVHVFDDPRLFPNLFSCRQIDLLLSRFCSDV
jgi:hypothetical protein